MAHRWLFLVLLAACGGTPDSTETAPAGAAKAAKAKAPGKAAKAKAKPKSGEEVEKTTVQVYFLDQAKFDAGEEPYLVAVEREVGAKAPERNALAAMFRGPNDEEKEKGLAMVRSGAAGFQGLKIEDGTATLKLRGGCEGKGATHTVFDHIRATLTGFDSVEHVKLMDPDGATADAEGEGDSRPGCLEP